MLEVEILVEAKDVGERVIISHIKKEGDSIVLASTSGVTIVISPIEELADIAVSYI